MLNEVLRRDTLSQAGRARAAKNKPESDAFWSLLGDAVFAVLVASSVRGTRRLRLLHPARLHRVFGRGVAHGAAEGQGRLDPYLLTKLTAAASAPGETPSKLRPGQERVFLRRRGRRAGRHKPGRRHQ